MTVEKIIAEIKRQLTLKSEITSVGPPHVILNGPEVLKAIGQEMLVVIEEIRKLEREECIEIVKKLVHRPEPVIEAIRARK